MAGNGNEALAALERQPFDLVLIDVQMPERDGLEATTLIRQKEQGTGRRVPIIAMTAYALKGDRERCLAAGMDGYLSKPVRLEQLLEAIAGLAPQFAAVEQGVPSAPSAAGVLDEAEALGYVGGDRELLRELVGIFLDNCPKRLSELREALGRRDCQALQRMAHTIKGELGSFGAKAAVEAALRLETMARAGDLTDAEVACAALDEAMHHLQPALVAFGKHNKDS